MLTFLPFRMWCLKNGKKRDDVAKDAALSLNTVNDIYNDKFPFKTNTIEALCRAYQLRIEEVIEYKEDTE